VRDTANFACSFKLIWAVQSFRQKYCSFVFAEIMICSSPSRPEQEGRLANVTTRWAGMRWTRERRARRWLQGGFAVSDRTARGTSGAQERLHHDVGGVARNSVACVVERLADGEVVWSWRPNALAPSLEETRAEPNRAAMRDVAQGDGGKRDGSPRRSRISRNTIARGRSVVTACTCGLRASRNFFCAKAPGACGHPAFPAPSIFPEGQEIIQSLGRNTSRE
jgi:hypothetical protein